MTPDEIRAELQAFVARLDEPAGDEDEDREALVQALDRLALVMHFVTFTFDDREHPDPPERDDATMRPRVEERFPWLGHYNVALDVSTSIGEGTCGVGDGVDDVMDIAHDLTDVLWRWEHTSEADALWHLEFSFTHHWGEHLRELQLYLWKLARDG